MVVGVGWVTRVPWVVGVSVVVAVPLEPGEVKSTTIIRIATRDTPPMISQRFLFSLRALARCLWEMIERSVSGMVLFSFLIVL